MRASWSLANIADMKPSLGQEIRRLRTEANRTLRSFAEELEISAPYLSDLERGRRQPPEKLLRKIAEMLRVPFGELKALDTRLDPELKDWMDRTPAATHLLRQVKESGVSVQEIMKSLERSLKKRAEEDEE